jgi:hypothetical protein
LYCDVCILKPTIRAASDVISSAIDGKVPGTSYLDFDDLNRVMYYQVLWIFHC